MNGECMPVRAASARPGHRRGASQVISIITAAGSFSIGQRRHSEGSVGRLGPADGAAQASEGAGIEAGSAFRVRFVRSTFFGTSDYEPGHKTSALPSSLRVAMHVRAVRNRCFRFEGQKNSAVSMRRTFAS
jgi:hypothetical protein